MNRRLLVCDLDNTLYDWVGYFVPAFYAMVDEVVRITDCDRERLLDDFRAVHVRHRDSEHPFSLLETKIMQEIFPGQSHKEIVKRLDPAFHEFNIVRKERLRVYDGVHEGLAALSRSGVTLVAHTESKLYAVIDRLTRLELIGYFRRIYCRERAISQHPNPEIARRWLERVPIERFVELSHHQRKPDPDVLLEICRGEGVAPEEIAYVGDSVARDILMAKMAGAFAIWARYGALPDENDYRKLVRISHWTKEDIKREGVLKEKAREIEPDFVLHHNFMEIIHAI